MRCVIYAPVDVTGIADREVAIWDREVEADIARCRAERDGQHAEQSWIDYLPVAVVESSDAVVVDGRLSWGSHGMRAHEVLLLDRTSQVMHGVYVLQLDTSMLMRGGPELRVVE